MHDSLIRWLILNSPLTVYKVYSLVSYWEEELSGLDGIEEVAQGTREQQGRECVQEVQAEKKRKSIFTSQQSGISQRSYVL